MSAQMIQVVENSLLPYLGILFVAALFGGIGGLAFELLQTHDKDTGALEQPKMLEQGGRSYRDLGWYASVILGAIAAIAVLYVFPPQITVDPTGNEAPAVYYNFVQLAALSLIVGSAAGGFLSALQARVLATVSEQRAQVAEAVNAATSEQTRDVLKDDVKNDVENTLNSELFLAVQKIAGQNSARDPERIARELTDRIAGEVIGTVQDRVDDRIQAAQKTVAKTISAASVEEPSAAT
jgi:hypothetical protein